MKFTKGIWNQTGVWDNLLIYKGKEQSYNQKKASRELFSQPSSFDGGERVRVLTGGAIIQQVVTGKLRFYHRRLPQFRRYAMGSWQEEAQRLHVAESQAVLELAGLYGQALSEIGEETASIFSIHAMLLEDGNFVETANRMLREEGVTAEYAVYQTGERIAAEFAAMDSHYMRARGADFRDISRRVLRILVGGWPVPRLDEPAILVSREFLPSEVVTFKRRHVLAVVSQRGSVDSHTAMLLQAYQIPAMAEVDIGEEWDGHWALMDGYAHRLYLDPDKKLQEELHSRYRQGQRTAEYVF